MTIDRRIRKSQVAMRNAFIELLHQHQLEPIRRDYCATNCRFS
ncbi:truncated bacterial regulatory s, tetR family protein [Staphylococcus aureus]|nr:truncated bacterial regulatory s, tetR family protein [Staphylococcus aureus]